MVERVFDPPHPEGLTDAQERLADSLFKSGAFLFDFEDGFVLKSGLRSPIYIDLRRLQSYPDTMDEAVIALIEQTQGLEFDRVAGVPMAAIPMATLFSNRLRKPQIQPRMESKTHGIVRSIDGIYNPGETALVIDDLVTTGGSKFEVIEILRESGLVVRDVVVVFDRQQGGEQQLAEKGLSLHAALKIKPCLQLYERQGRINQEQFTTVINYLGDTQVK